jgi:hypothetical protein
MPAALALLDRAVEWRPAKGNPYQQDGSPWVGIDAVVQHAFEGDDWDDFAISAPRLHVAGDTVVAECRYVGTHRASGRTLNAPRATSGSCAERRSSGCSSTPTQRSGSTWARNKGGTPFLARDRSMSLCQLYPTVKWYVIRKRGWKFSTRTSVCVPAVSGRSMIA